MAGGVVDAAEEKELPTKPPRPVFNRLSNEAAPEDPLEPPIAATTGGPAPGVGVGF